MDWTVMHPLENLTYWRSPATFVPSTHSSKQMFFGKIVEWWIRTQVIWCRKWPLCQLCHNHCPRYCWKTSFVADIFCSIKRRMFNLSALPLSTNFDHFFQRLFVLGHFLIAQNYLRMGLSSLRFVQVQQLSKTQLEIN